MLGLAVEVVVRLRPVRFPEEADGRGLELDELPGGSGERSECNAAGYVGLARELLGQVKFELGRGDARQAAEKVWVASVLAVKAYVCWRFGRRVSGRREVWEYCRVMAEELGGWVFDVLALAYAMHGCFYEGWCGRAEVEYAAGRVGKLVAAVESMVSRG
jgi:hypothetical protein